MDSLAASAITQTSSADLSAYRRRSEVWSRIGGPARAGMFLATARAASLSIPLSGAEIEHDLLHAMFGLEVFAETVRQNPARAIDLLQVFPRSAIADYVHIVVSRESLPEAVSSSWPGCNGTTWHS